MIDLHLHFDGSVPPECIYRLAQRAGICLPDIGTKAFRDCISVGETCTDLNSYLDKFTVILELLQTKEALSEAMEALTRELYREGMLYAEVRFAPSSHTKRGLSQQEVLDAVLVGLQRAEAEAETISLPQTEGETIFWKQQIGLILCCMRGCPDPLVSLETIRLAYAYRDKGVKAVDLAGAEALFPTKDHAELFSEAVKLGMPFTIHAGEAAGAQSIWQAAALGASRIGHGIRAFEDPQLLCYLKEKQLPLECCPISNQHTHALPEDRTYPLREYLEQGLCVTVNTDNRTISDTNLDKEYYFLEQQCGITEKQKETLLLNSISAAFLSEAEKHSLKQALFTKIS